MKAVSPGYRPAAAAVLHQPHPCSVVLAGIPQEELATVYSLKQDLSH